MSLVSSYIKCGDGIWYQNPVFRSDDAFLCFDDDDPPELVVKDGSVRTISEILEGYGIKRYRVLGSPQRSGRFFGNECCDAVAYFLKLKGPIGTPTEHQGTITSPNDIMQGCFEDYG